MFQNALKLHHKLHSNYTQTALGHGAVWVQFGTNCTLHMVQFGCSLTQTALCTLCSVCAAWYNVRCYIILYYIILHDIIIYYWYDMYPLKNEGCIVWPSQKTAAAWTSAGKSNAPPARWAPDPRSRPLAHCQSRVEKPARRGGHLSHPWESRGGPGEQTPCLKRL